MDEHFYPSSKPRRSSAPVMPSLWDSEPETDIQNTTIPEAVNNRHDTERWAEQAASEHAAEIALLIPIAQRLAAASGEEGVTIADVRSEAVKLGILPPLGEGRSLSYLGAVCRRAGLVATGKTRRSHIEGAHANRGTVWVSGAVARSAA